MVEDIGDIGDQIKPEVENRNKTNDSAKSLKIKKPQLRN